MNEVALVELGRISKMWIVSSNILKRAAAIWLYYLLAQVLLVATLLVAYIGLMLFLAIVGAARGGATPAPGLMGL